MLCCNVCCGGRIEPTRRGQRLALLGPIFALAESQFKPNLDLFSTAPIPPSNIPIGVLTSRKPDDYPH